MTATENQARSILGRLRSMSVNDNENGQAGIAITREFVTPDVAKRWLEAYNPSNRRIRATAVERYARAMREGRWFENAVPIVFGKSGRLLDGQHRLMAIHRSGVGLWMHVARGVADDAFVSFDDPVTRTASDHITFRDPGERNPNIVAAAARLLWMYRRSGHFGEYRPAPDKWEVLNHIAEEPGLSEAVARSAAWQRQIRVITPSLLATLYYLFSRVSEEDAEIFFERWATGLGLASQTDPIWQLRKRFEDPLLQQRSARLRNMQAALVIKAWNAFRENRSVKLLRWNGPSGEVFPIPV